ncbi:MAG: hypothetical protein IT380_19595 [Myxococcales bacterium]|nr:hypothetical protein [Myxococcales bacterium]
MSHHLPASRRAPRGYTLVFVMVMLLVLTVLATGVLKTSVSEAAALDSSRFQNQAAINSAAGIQDGLARLRTGLSWQTLPLCAQAETCGTTPPPFTSSPPLLAGETQARYTVSIFQRDRRGLDGAQQGISNGNSLPLVVLTSVGRSQDNDQYTAVIEVEVQMPSGGQGGNQVAGGG